MSPMNDRASKSILFPTTRLVNLYRGLVLMEKATGISAE